MKQLSLEEIRQKVTPILKQAGINRSSIFGSYVRGDNSENSDIDMLVAFPEDTTLIDMAHLKHQLEDILEKKVDLVSFNAISPLIRDSILQNQYALL